MSGSFELLASEDGQLGFQLISADGEILAFSVPYPDQMAAAAGIALVREIAGTGLISDCRS